MNEATTEMRTADSSERARRTSFQRLLALYFAADNAELSATEGDEEVLCRDTEQQGRIADGAPAETPDDLALRLAFLSQELLAPNAAITRDMQPELATCMSCLADAVMLAHGLRPRIQES